jgi:GTP-binding protein EngB required for normal cell division
MTEQKTTTLNRLDAHTANLARRLQALGRAVELAEGRVNPDTVADARAALKRAGERVAISGDKTVVALVGPTGAGKSSLFNALAKQKLAEVAVRRPTTASARAVAWGKSLPTELLDWLQIEHRHLIDSGDPELNNLVLLDLPDYDSVELEHRQTVDRLVKVVDALIWVVDPQKYADALLYEGYLAPLREYAEVMMVAFNKSDALAEADMNRCVRDLRKLLDENGLKATRIVVTAAAFDVGVPSLLDVIKRTVAAKVAMAARLSREVTVAATSVDLELGKVTPGVNRRDVEALTDALGDIAGASSVAAAVEEDWLSRGRAVTGWPFVSRRYRKPANPLNRLKASRKVKVDLSAEEALGFDGAVEKAKLEQGLRTFSDQVGNGLPAGWQRSVAQATRANSATLLRQLGDIATQQAGTTPKAGWWNIFRTLKVILLVAAVAGLLWLVSGPLLGLAGYDPLPAVHWLGIPAPVWLLVGGLVAGVLLGLLGRLLIVPGARAKGKAAARRIREQVQASVQAQVVAGVDAELKRLADAQKAIKQALR